MSDKAPAHGLPTLVAGRHLPANAINRESRMQAFKILFSTPTGLCSLAVIVFIIGMAVFFTRLFLRKMREDAAAARRA
jgi:hypothetical protein